MKWHPSTSKIPNTPFCCQTVHLIYRCHFCASLACLTYCLQKSLLASSSPSVGAKSLFISTAAYNLLSFCFSLQVMFPSSSPSSPLHNPLALPSAFSSESSRETSSLLLGPTLRSQQVLTGTTTGAQALHFHSAECKEAEIFSEQETPQTVLATPSLYTWWITTAPATARYPKSSRATAKTRDSCCWVVRPFLYHTCSWYTGA